MLRHSIHRFVLLAFGGLACHASRPRPSSPPPPSLTGEEEAAIIATATRLFDSAADKVPVCLTIQDTRERYAVSAHVMRALAPRARDMKDCPPTYESMILSPTLAKRPPGYIDPYQLELRWPVTTANAIVITAQLWQGTGFTAYRCEVRKEASDRSTACVVTGRGFS